MHAQDISQRKPKLVNMILIVGQWLLHVCVIFTGPSSMSTIYIDHKCSVMSRHNVFNQVNILNIDSSEVQIDTSLCLLGTSCLCNLSPNKNQNLIYLIPVFREHNIYINKEPGHFGQ